MSESYEVPANQTPRMPLAFIKRRLQSIAGFFLVLFLIEHLFINAQSALFFGDDPGSFMRMVNYLRSIPYLPVVEIVLLGVPFLIHAWWGIHRLYISEPNSFPTDGSGPDIEYPRNKAYTWQRITAIILVFGVIWHVASMRFINAPQEVGQGLQDSYFVKITMDPGLYTVADRLHVKLYDMQTLHTLEGHMQDQIAEARSILSEEVDEDTSLDLQEALFLTAKQRIAMRAQFISALKSQILKKGEVVAITENIGAAILLMVRDTFKSSVMCILYSLFLIAAVFHATNGLWTFLITWGITLTERSRVYARYMSRGLYVLLLFFGLASVWGTYWITLRE